MIQFHVLDLQAASQQELKRIEIKPSSVEIRKVFDDIVNTLTLQANKKGKRIVLQISPDVPEFLIIDATRVMQVLNNLLLNALKFSEHNTDMPRVDIEVYYISEQSVLQFSVCDFGIKISDREKSKLFQ